jgi:hypothetical protein
MLFFCIKVIFVQQYPLVMLVDSIVIVVDSIIPCTWNVVYELELAETWKKCNVYVGGMRICLWTAATDRHTVHPQAIYEYGGPRWNYIDREKPVILQEYSDLGVMPTTSHIQSSVSMLLYVFIFRLLGTRKTLTSPKHLKFVFVLNTVKPRFHDFKF